MWNEVANGRRLIPQSRSQEFNPTHCQFVSRDRHIKRQFEIPSRGRCRQNGYMPGCWFRSETTFLNVNEHDISAKLCWSKFMLDHFSGIEMRIRHDEGCYEI